MRNLSMPGNPRYQPKDLVEIFGYDNLAPFLVRVELAVMRALMGRGIIPSEDAVLLTKEREERLYAITTSQMDKVEREITKHDIRALVRLMQECLPPQLARWVHVPLTSFDVLETARALQFKTAHEKVVGPKLAKVISLFSERALEYADVPQIGRTHGQHAVPITVGFWLATVLDRILASGVEMGKRAEELCGKISGPVGAYNAQKALGIQAEAGKGSLEDEVLNSLGLETPLISTQILAPEPMAYYLFACTMLSAALAQFANDCRHLMRTEIAELGEPFEAGQVGSSTMAQKRNPVTFENICGMWLRNRNAFGLVFDTLVSEHQRDLVGSSLMRDFPQIIVNLVHQLDALLRLGGANKQPFLARISVDVLRCRQNVDMTRGVILAEPAYLVLQMYGYEGDAHELINHTVVPLVGSTGLTFYDALSQVAERDRDVKLVWDQVPHELKELFGHPEKYTGRAVAATQQICAFAGTFV